MGIVKVFSNKDAVKELCKGPGEMGGKMIVWDGETKMWGTKFLPNVSRLIASGMWQPKGIPVEWNGVLSQMCKAKSFFDDETKRVKQESKSKETSQKLDAERQAALEERKRRDQEQQQRNKLKAMLEPTEKEMASIADLGVTSDAVAFAMRLEATFGPVAGMSPEGRVLRWMGFKFTEARVKAYSELGARWLTEEDLFPYYMSTSQYWANALNEAAKRNDTLFDEHYPGKKTGASRKKNKRDYKDVYSGDAATPMQIDAPRSATFNSKPISNHTPSSAGYVSVCETCQGVINCQFPECLCTQSWLPCHGCGSFVALHQKCRYGHDVDYPPPEARLFAKME